MKLSIIVEDGSVIVDGDGFTGVTLVGVPADIRALQWTNDVGHVEKLNGDNTPITGLPQWALDAVQLMYEERGDFLPDYSSENAAAYATWLAQLEVYPQANADSVDALVNSGLPSIQVVPYIRESDNTLIGVFSGYMIGAEGVASFHTLTQIQAKLGCPIFAQPSPKDPAMLPQFIAMIEAEGYTVIGQEDKYSFPAWTLLMAKAAAKISKTAELFSNAEDLGFTWGSYVFDADATARANVAAKAVQLLLDPAITQVGWKLKDNTLASIPVADFKQVALDMTLYMENVYQQSWALKDQIDAAATLNEVEAI